MQLTLFTRTHATCSFCCAVKTNFNVLKLHIQRSKWKDNTLSCMGLMDRSDNLTHPGGCLGSAQVSFLYPLVFFFFFFTAKVFHMNTQCYFISKKATSDKASELFSPSEGKPEHSISTSPFAPCACRQVRASYYGYRNALCCSETFSRFPVTGF